jgi:hypothetical protein
MLKCDGFSFGDRAQNEYRAIAEPHSATKKPCKFDPRRAFRGSPCKAPRTGCIAR